MAYGMSPHGPDSGPTLMELEGGTGLARARVYPELKIADTVAEHELKSDEEATRKMRVAS